MTTFTLGREVINTRKDGWRQGRHLYIAVLDNFKSGLSVIVTLTCDIGLLTNLQDVVAFGFILNKALQHLLSYAV